VRRAAGFTLIEVLIVVTLMVAVTGTFGAVAGTIHARDRTTAAYAEDLAGLRRAVRTLRSDLRAARSTADLDWHLEGGVLRRGSRVIARHIAAFGVRARGSLAQVRIALAPRSDAPTRREAILDFAVHMPTAETER
jgi:prepilin-type N-terminal cleavage/methylation domain-containing protein